MRNKKGAILRIASVFAIILFAGTLLGQPDFSVAFRDITDPVEIVFVMDTSGSMVSQLAGLLENVGYFAAAISDSGLDSRFGGVTFADGDNLWDFDPVASGTNMTNDVAEFQALLDGISASGGGDTPEISIDAIYDGATGYDWTPGSLHLMLMFTDANYHIPGDVSGYSDVSIDELIETLITGGFILYTAGDSATYYHLADTTGGAFFPLPSVVVPPDTTGGGDSLLYRAYTEARNWGDITNQMVKDMMSYYVLNVTISGLSGYELTNVELSGLSEFETTGPRVVDLSGSEYAGVDEIHMAWSMKLIASGTTTSDYTLTLRTSSGDIEYEGTIEYTGGSSSVIMIPKQPQRLNISAYPSPFNSACVVSGIPQDGRVEIYDIRGNLVKSGLQSISDGTYIWQPDGTDNSGIYLVKAVAGAKEVTKRIVYLK